MVRARDRYSALGLLPRMEARPWSDGKTVTYRYKPVEGKPINLGTDKHAAIRKVLDLTGRRETHGTLQWVWEQFQETAQWTDFTAGTREDYTLCAIQLIKVFGQMQIAAITSPMISRYMRIERKKAPVRANREKSLLSNLFYCGVDLGVCDTNPAKHVKPNPERPRPVAPEKKFLASFLAWLDKQTAQRRVIGLAAEFCSLGGARKVEFLPACWTNVDESNGEIRLFRGKQRKGKVVVDVIKIEPAMTALLARIRNLNRDCLYLFPTRDNNAYSARGFKSLWQRCIQAAIADGVITQSDRFTFHDLRAYYATEHKRILGGLPDMHKNPETTARVYDRNEEVKRRSL